MGPCWSGPGEAVGLCDWAGTAMLACPPQHKKLAEGSAYEEVPTSVMYSENDISNSIKNGILYLEDPVNHVGPHRAGLGRAGGRVLGWPCHTRVSLFQEWYPHYFVLTSSKIYYSEETSSDQGNEDEEEPKEVRGRPGAKRWALGAGWTRSRSVAAAVLPCRPAAAQSCTPTRSGSTGSSGLGGTGGTSRSACSQITASRPGPPMAPSWCARARPSWATTPSLSGNPLPVPAPVGCPTPGQLWSSLSLVPGFRGERDFTPCAHASPVRGAPSCGAALCLGFLRAPP